VNVQADAPFLTRTSLVASALEAAPYCLERMVRNRGLTTGSVQGAFSRALDAVCSVVERCVHSSDMDQFAKGVDALRYVITWGAYDRDDEAVAVGAAAAEAAGLPAASLLPRVTSRVHHIVVTLGEAERVFSVCAQSLTCLHDMMASHQEEAEAAADSGGAEEKEEAAEKLQEMVDVGGSMTEDVMDTVSTLCAAVGKPVLPVLRAQPLWAKLTEWSTLPDGPMVVFRNALGYVVCDLLEYLSPESQELVTPVLEPLLSQFGFKEPHSKQLSAYLVKLLVLHARHLVEPKLKSLCGRLLGMLLHKDAKKREMQFASDNATAALVAVVAVCGRDTMRAEAGAIMKAVRKYLPLMRDEAEAREVHGALIEAIVTGDELWLGAGGKDCGDAVAALARVFESLRPDFKALRKRGRSAAAEEDDDDDSSDGDSSGDGVEADGEAAPAASSAVRAITEASDNEDSGRFVSLRHGRLWHAWVQRVTTADAGAAAPPHWTWVAEAFAAMPKPQRAALMKAGSKLPVPALRPGAEGVGGGEVDGAPSGTSA